MRFSLLITLVTIFLAASPGRVEAHRVNVFAYVEGTTCYVQGYFSRSRRAQNARVEVFDPEGNLLLEGKTDGEGNFSFPVPKPADLRIVLTAGLGHQNEFLLPASEAGGARAEKSPSREAGSPAAGEAKNLGDAAAKGPLPSDPEILRKIIDEALNRHLRPVYSLVSEIEEERNRVSLKEIVSGIGYLAGIFGIAFFVAAKRKGK